MSVGLTHPPSALHFLFRLVKLAFLPFDAIRGPPEGIVTLRVLKAERIGDLLGDPVWDEELLADLSRQFLDFVVRYVLEGGVDTTAFQSRIKVITNPEIKSAAMTIAEELRKQGRQEGRQQGRQEAMQNAILDNLEVRFGSVPQGLREAVGTVCDESRLRALHRASVTVASIEEFAQEL